MVTLNGTITTTYLQIMTVGILVGFGIGMTPVLFGIVIRGFINIIRKA